MGQLNHEYDLLYKELVSKAKNRPLISKEVIKASQMLDKCKNKVMKKKFGSLK